MPDAWGIFAIALKWALYLGVLGASGNAFCALIFRLAPSRQLIAGFAVFGLLAAGLSFMVKGVALTGDASGMTDPEMLGLLWGTQSGTALQLQSAGLFAVVAGLFLGRLGVVLSAIGGVVALWSFITTGHIADRDSVLLTAVLLLHLLGAAFWIGILAPLYRLTAQESTFADAATLGHRFGQLAMLAVPGLIAAGAVMTYAIVGSLASMSGTNYGQALLVKIGIVGVLLGLAAANKMQFVPGLARGDATAATLLRRSILFEWIAVLAILAVTAVLTTSLTLPT